MLNILQVTVKDSYDEMCRYAAEEIVDPSTGALIVRADQMITPTRASMIEAAGIRKVKVPDMRVELQALRLME